jgi:two-component system response regulator PilR (NtrC family)
VVLADGDLIGLEHFPALHEQPRPVPLVAVPARRLRLREMEKQYILETLEQTRWNRAQAARLLGISIRGLQYKLQRYLGEDKNVAGILSAAER